MRERIASIAPIRRVQGATTSWTRLDSPWRITTRWAGGVSKMRTSQSMRRRTTDGTKFDGAAALQRALLSRPDIFVGTLTE